MSRADAANSVEGPTPQRATAARQNWRRLRAIPLAIGAVSMACGLWVGLARLGLALPDGMPAMAEFHGALMICGFLGTLISLERAVAFGVRWANAAPALSSIGALALFVGMPRLGALAFISAGAILWLASVALAVRQLALFTVVLAVGAACWSVGTLEWLLGSSTPAVTGWWLTFLILTIAAERLELSRLLQPPRSSQVAFSIVVLLLLIGSTRGELAGEWAPFTAAGLLGCAAWLLQHDVARRTIRISGQARFCACAILAGHVWLGAAGALLFVAPPGTAVFSYDAVVHAIAIGFVLSMVLGHAPIILPAVSGMRVRFSAWAFIPLVLLHISVAMRLGGDIYPSVELRVASGMLTVIALASYAATLAIASWKRRPLPEA
jgi:hypothetical protein